MAAIITKSENIEVGLNTFRTHCIFTFTFRRRFIQSDSQMRDKEAIKINKEQWYASAITSLS